MNNYIIKKDAFSYFNFVFSVLLISFSFKNFSDAFIKTPLLLNQYQKKYNQKNKKIHHLSSSSSSIEETRDLSVLAKELTVAIEKNTESFRNLKCYVAPSSLSQNRLGLFASVNLNQNDVAVAIPYSNNPCVLVPTSSKLKQLLPEDYEGWTGDAGLLALELLLEVSKSENEFMKTWIMSLPTPNELNHPLLWKEEDQELLQSCSSKKIYRLLDDIEDDFSWLQDKIFSKSPQEFPTTVTLTDNSVASGSRTMECFTLTGYKWALAIVYSRSFFVDGMLRLIPILDYVNHSSENSYKEIQGDYYMGTFKTVQGVPLTISKATEKDQEILVSYGPKSAIEYLLEHGFVPTKILEAVESSTPKLLKQYATSQITLELDTDDRFYEDKLDILENEAQIDTMQTFDLYENDGDLDSQMIQFLRLIKLGSTDAFLLESLFRNEVWDFMYEPVSELNEQNVVEYVINYCSTLIEELEQEQDREGSSDEITKTCHAVRVLELRALTATRAYMTRDREALDLKEYYQERRLKDLGLDSEWDPDDVNSDVGWGVNKRVPGGGDLDW